MPMSPDKAAEEAAKKEMGFSVGRKHGEKLRRYANVLAFILPILFLSIVQQNKRWCDSGWCTQEKPSGEDQGHPVNGYYWCCFV